MFKLCILEAGYINPALKDKYPPYSDLFKDFLKYKTRNWHVSSYRLYESEFPHSINDFDGFIITGSSFGVYENFSWIIKTIRLINQIISKKKQLVGICFGHQIIIQALNGLIEKSIYGWGAGIKKINFFKNKPWLPNNLSYTNLISFHQDQVVEIPKCVDHLAGNDSCKYYSLALEDIVFTIQGHPEFSKKYTLDLLNLRREGIGEVEYLKGVTELKKLDHQGKLFGNIIANFLERKF